MIIRWLRQRYQRTARDYEDGGLLGVWVGLRLDQAAGDLITTGEAAFRRTVTLRDVTVGRTVTLSVVGVRRVLTLTTSGARRTLTTVMAGIRRTLTSREGER